MSKEELWRAVCERYPEFKDPDYILKQRAKGLRRLIEQAWDEGHTAGVKNGKALQREAQRKADASNPFPTFR